MGELMKEMGQKVGGPHLRGEWAENGRPSCRPAVGETERRSQEDSKKEGNTQE